MLFNNAVSSAGMLTSMTSIKMVRTEKSERRRKCSSFVWRDTTVQYLMLHGGVSLQFKMLRGIFRTTIFLLFYHTHLGSSSPAKSFICFLFLPTHLTSPANLKLFDLIAQFTGLHFINCLLLHLFKSKYSQQPCFQISSALFSGPSERPT